MPLSADQLEKIQIHLSSPGVKKECGVCNQENWAIENELAVFPLFNLQTRTIIDDQVYPLVLLSCLNCGNTLLLNAKRLNVL